MTPDLTATVDPAGEAPLRRGGRGRARSRALAFVLVRVTGLLLAVLVLGHFTLTHISTDVAETDAAFVSQRWSSALWLAWDWLLLVSAISHGAMGIWIAIEDYTPDSASRARRCRALALVSVAAVALGTITMLAFLTRG